MAAKGEKTFSIGSQQVKRFVNEPVPNKEWRFVLDAKGANIRKPQDESKPVAYVGGIKLRLIGSAREEGQKDRSIFHSLYLSLKPGKDGVLNPNRGGGLTELCKAMGQANAEFPETEYTTADGETVEPGLDAKAVLNWVKELDGMEGGCRTKTKKNLKGEDESVVDYFIEAEQDSSSSDEDEDEDGKPEDEETEEVVEEDEPPVRLPVKKAAGKKK